jgi:hypothetical protein
VIKSGRTRGRGYTASIKVIRKAKTCCSGLKGEHHFRELNIDGRRVLKWI